MQATGIARRVLGTVSALGLAAAILSPAAQAQPVLLATAFTFLTGDQETPPVDSPAIGAAVFELFDDNGNRSIAYSILIEGIDFGPATDDDPATVPTDPLDATGLHIHFAPPDEPGPIQYGLFGPTHDFNGNITFTELATDEWLIEGSWDEGDGNPEEPFGDVDAAIAALLAFEPGELTPFYLNAHTRRNPMGEIRGHLVLDSVAVPEPGMLSLLGLGIPALALARRRRTAEAA